MECNDDPGEFQSYLADKARVELSYRVRRIKAQFVRKKANIALVVLHNLAPPTQPP